MPTTVAATLIIVFALLPGIVGEKIYHSLVGTDWRDRTWFYVIRLLGFSLGGLVFYTLVATVFRLSPPLHIFPSTIEALKPDDLNRIIIPYTGHIIGGAIAGLTVSFAVRWLSHFGSTSPYPSAWDGFVRNCVKDHWVVVSLESGDVYAGIINNIDASVTESERDLVLEEPCRYDPDTKNYIATSYQHLFIPAKLILSIGTVYEKRIDKRLSKVGQVLFSSEVKDVEQQA